MWDGRAGSADRRFHDLARLARRLALGQRVDIVHAFDHLAPDGVLIVEEARVLEADEELTVRAVRVLRARHRADAADVRRSEERSVGKERGRRCSSRWSPYHYKQLITITAQNHYISKLISISNFATPIHIPI